MKRFLAVILLLASCTPGPKTPAPTGTPSHGPTAVASSIPTLFSTVPGDARPMISDACRNYRWGNRGKAPLGMLNSLALLQLRGMARASHGSVLGNELGDPNKDALSHYEDIFKKAGISLDSAADKVAATYLLLVGLAMRESSGNYLEGWDVAGSRTENGAEAGLFQVSYDSLNGNPELKQLYEEYREDISGCMLGSFRPGSYAPTSKNATPIGSGAGRDFQVFTKACPAFAVEYAAVMLRTNAGRKGHFGPTRRFEAEINKDCLQ